MQGKTIVLAAIACGTLAACGTTGRTLRYYDFNPFLSKKDCKEANCRLEVTVEASATGACKPKVEAILDVSQGEAGERDITWTLTTAGYEFSRANYKYGIFIETDPFDQFKGVQIPGNGRTLTLKFSNSKKGESYKYALTVRRSEGNQEFCETLDPWLIS